MLGRSREERRRYWALIDKTDELLIWVVGGLEGDMRMTISKLD